MTSPWRVETVAGSAARLLDPPAITERAVRFLVPKDRAVVLGSTQPESHIDRVRADATGTRVLRRRGGGGAVLVGPGQVLWTDVLIPKEDPLWTDDVGRAFWWLGDVWIAALGAVGLEGAQAWRLGLRPSPWSDRVCFAGLGPGEVTLGDAKVVGISQRRTRAGAHFQCAVPLLWNPSDLLDLMVLDRDTRRRATTQLADVALGVGADVGPRLMAALLDGLP